MNRLITITFSILVIIAIIAGGISLHEDKEIRTEWEENREVSIIVISSGDDLWSIAEEYKPSWMDPREYIYEVQKLNNMSQSCIYAGEQLLIYM